MKYLLSTHVLHLYRCSFWKTSADISPFLNTYYKNFKYYIREKKYDVDALEPGPDELEIFLIRSTRIYLTKILHRFYKYELAHVSMFPSTFILY